MPNEKSEARREPLAVGLRYFVLGLSIDGAWAQLLTRRNSKGWVRIDKIYRLPNSDPDLHNNFEKLVERSHWETKILALNAGVYPTQDYVGEVALTILPRGINGLMGETLDIVAGGVLVKATENLPANTAYRVLLQWPFRMLALGNLYAGPRAGYEMRKRFKPVGVQTAQTGHFGVMGLIFRYMPNSLIGVSLAPEFLLHSQEATFHAYLALTLML